VSIEVDATQGVVRWPKRYPHKEGVGSPWITVARAANVRT